ncbi:MAG: helix-turn-helix transcriptional regulator [Lachnospiraceae bacterium]|nr:helix-turn-helix transcriptional regulator [Lachnospiraceae bacterium]
MDIGHRLKQMRVRQSLTLEELASRSELTKGFLSQVERNLTSPSIATLTDILEALGSSLGEFFGEEKPEQIVFRKGDFFLDERDDYSVHWIVPNTQKNEMEPILLEIPAKSRSFSVNPHNGEEFGYVLEGTVSLEYGGKSNTVRRGETFYLKGRDEHYISNKGNKTARVLWVSTPPIF